jgi:enoyl-CoA hydratase
MTLCRPHARNAIDSLTHRALVGSCAEADRDPDIGAVVLTGEDPAFSSGVDLKEALSDAGYRRPRSNPGQVLRAMATPVVAAVNGACVAGALEVALSCSFIVASERARFADTHPRVGMVPSWGLSAMLPQAVGVRRARQLSLTGAFLSAHQAMAWGLVNEVVSHEVLLERALELAASMSELPPSLAEVTLGLYAKGEGASLTSGLGLEAEAHALWRVDGEGARMGFARSLARGRDGQGTS